MKARGAGWLLAVASVFTLAACAADKSSVAPVAAVGEDVTTIQSAVNTTVDVTVVDTNGAPKVGALVYAQKKSTSSFVQSQTTNSSGVASFSLANGQYKFAHQGYGGGDGAWFWSSSNYACQTPSCTSATITVTIPVLVTVVDANGVPQADTPVYAADSTGVFVNGESTDSAGQVLLSMYQGTPRFAVPTYQGGFFFWSADCPIPGCTTASITVQAPIDVSVVNSSGQPLADVEVLTEGTDGYYYNLDFTDATGHVLLSADAGAWRVAAPYGAVVFYSGPSGHCVVPGCTAVTIMVPEPVTVSVVDGSGQPMANQGVLAEPEGCELSTVYQETDAAGHTTFVLPMGAWRFKATCGCEVFYSGAAGSCTVPGCATANITMICGACTGQPDGTTCSDGDACTQTDTCQAGACVGANPVVCSGDQCHDAGTCNSATGTCSNPPKANGTACNDSNACTQTDTCQAGTCTGGNPVTCVAQDQCHDAGTCNTATGACSNPAKANGAACNDGDACTQTDTCQTGACSGGNPVTCVAQDQCHDAGTCNASTGACSNPAKANGTACNDGNACTQTDTCQAGACSGGNPVTCLAQDQCHDAGTCNTSTGACSNPEKANGTACNDSNACTQADTCQAGSCAGGNPVTCVAQDQCHGAGTCNSATGACSNPTLADGSSCSDGDSCTSGETCQSGSCAGGTPSCGPITITQEIIYNRVIPQLSATLLADRTQAAGGDAVQFTSTVTNAGAMLDTQMGLDVENVSASTFVVQGWQLAYEYQAVPSGEWTPFARVRVDASGNLVPETTLVPITFSFMSPGGAAGTSIAPGATAHWWLEIIPVIPPDVLDIVFDPAQSSGVRFAARFDVPSEAPRSGSTPLTYPGLNLDIDNITADFGLTFISLSPHVPAVGPLTSSGTGPLAPGASRIFTGTFTAPVMPPFPAWQGETEGDYRGRLLNAANGYQPHVHVNGTATPFNPPTFAKFTELAFEFPRFAGMQKTGPATVNAGVATIYSLTLPNNGNGAASNLAITDAIDGQPVTIGNLSAPATIAAGATAGATFTAAPAVDRPPGPMTDVASLTWQDRNGNVFGPLSASFSNNAAAGHPEGYLSLTAPAPDLPILVGTTEQLTVTARDPYGSPAPGVTVHFTVTGPHAQTADIVTGADGKAVLSYAGTTIGVDRVVASATVTTSVVTTNVLNIQWATATGTPCTGRATPLDIMLVVDVSGSMIVEPPFTLGSQSTGKLEAAHAAAVRFMENLNPTRDQVGLVVFRARVDRFVPLSFDPENVKPHLASGVEGGIFCASNNCDPGAAGSRLDVGLDAGLDELESPRHRAEAQRVIVYIGDGGTDGVSFATELARLQATGTKVVVLAIGSEIDGTVGRQVATTANDYFYSPSGTGVDYAFNNLNQDLCRNRPPFVSAGGDQGAYNIRIPSFLALQGEVHDDRAVADARLTSEWSVVSGPGVVTFADATAPATHALFSEPGTYVLQLAATDGYLTVADRATITVDPDPSIVGANLMVALAAPGPLETGQSESLIATLTDGGGQPIRDYVVRMTVAGANPVTTTLTTNNLGVATFTYQGAKTGMDVLHATALGSTLQLDSAFLSVDWIQPASGGAFLTQGWIGAPLDQAKLMERVDIVLSPDVTLASGTVKYFPTEAPTDIHFLATNTSGNPGATLATFDTTTVSNGSYVIQLDGTDNAGNQKTSTVLVTVTGDYKPGRVVVELTDFELPLAGLPIKIGRRYDSLDKDKVGDFGHGWSLAIGHPRLQTNPNFGVSLTLPNGRRATFDLALDVVMNEITGAPSFFGIYSPFYRAEPGVYGSLTQEGACPYVRYNPSNPGNPLSCFFTFGFIPGYAPEFFTYTDPFGTAYRMTASGELKSITDRQGNTLSFEPNGIISNSGQSVMFERDGQGRIAKVLPPQFFGPGSGPIQYLYEYDANGDLTTVQLPPTIAPPGGEVFRHTYDGAHRLLTTVDPRGNPVRTSTYDANGRLATDNDALNNVTSYAYNLDTRTTTTTYPDTGVFTQVFDARGLVVSETNQLGHTTTREFDANRNETKRTNAVNEITTATYDERGNQTSVTDPTGTTHTTYSEQNLPIAFEDRLGHVITIEYDDRDLPARFADELGTRFKFTNSEQGLPLVVEDAAGKRAYAEYDAVGSITARTDWLGRVSRWRYDDAGDLTHETSARGATKVHQVNFRGKRVYTEDHDGTRHHISRDANDNVTAELVTDFNYTDQRQTSYTYNQLNQVTQLAYPFAGTSVNYARDFRGNPVSVTDEGGRVTTHEYDRAGQLKKTTFPDGRFITRMYDPLGRLASTTDERGNTTTYQYEPGCGCSDRVTSVTDPLGHTTTTTYDANGRRTSITDASNHTTSFVYDVRGHVIETHYADGTVVDESYDDRGRRTSMTDQTGATTLFGYDDQGQLTSVTDPLGNITTYAYDLDGNLTSNTDANNHTTTYEYDLFNRKTKRTLPLGQFETFTYDPVGNIKSHTDFRGKTTTTTWDARDRILTRVPDPSLGEPSHTYTYSPTGMRLIATRGSDTTSYTYDVRDRMLTKSAPAGTLTYTYDATGNVATIRSSNASGTSVDYVWDAANQLASITDNRTGGTTTAAHTPTNRPDTLAHPNGVRLMYSYDGLDRVSSLLWRHGTSAPFANWTYTHNLRGQRTRSTDITGRSTVYGYDGGSRLISEIITDDPRGPTFNGAISYVIDGAGNRISRASTLVALSAQSFAYNANDELSSDTYDASGNTIASDGHTYAYDVENQLVSKDGGVVTIKYDCDGNRVAKIVDGVTTHYLVDDLNPTGYLQTLEEIVSGAVQTRYTYGTSIVSQTRNVSTSPITTYYGYDAHGNISFLTDTNGVVTDSYDYDAWGNVVASTGNTPNTRFYTGEEVDPHLGSIMLRARLYNPGSGRFLTIDPAPGQPLYPVSLNRYVYGNVDPVNLKDPTGLAAPAPAPTPGGAGGAISEYFGLAVIATALAPAAKELGRRTSCQFLEQASTFSALAGEGEPGQVEILAEGGKRKCGKYTCECRCSANRIGGGTKEVAYRLSAKGSGATKFAACKVAETTLRNSTPRGFRTVHCDGCQNLKNCWRS